MMQRRRTGDGWKPPEPREHALRDRGAPDKGGHCGLSVLAPQSRAFNGPETQKPRRDGALWGSSAKRFASA